MSRRSLGLPDDLYDYLLQTSLREPPLLQQLREETAQHPSGGMQISPEQGQLMGLLVELCGARRAVEVGVFTGYSTLSVARSLPADGYLLACDVSDEYTQIARRYFAEAGLAERIELVIAPARMTLAARLAAGEAGSYDFAFIDADKESYDAYYEACLELLRPGGLLLIDNVLWDGRVADPANQEASTLAIRALNLKMRDDLRVTQCLLPVGDGLSLARKR